MDKTTIRIKSAVDLLALVPCVMGFHPEDSLVLVVVAGDGDHLQARVDLSTEPDELLAGLSSLVTPLLRSRAREVVLVAYTQDRVLAEDAVGWLTDTMSDLGVAVRSAIRADGLRWYNLLCAEDCCPPHGSPYDLTTHPFTAQSVLDGQVTYRSRRDLADSLIGTDTADMEAVLAAADGAMRRFHGAARHPLGMELPDGTRQHLVAEGCWVRDRVRRFLATREPLDPDEAGRMVVAMVNIAVRDVAWAEMTRATARTHVELWRDLVRRTPLDLAAAPSALLGFAAWLDGDGALAWCAVERCQEADPDYSMAELLTHALTEAVPPSTWKPLTVEDLPLFAG